MLLPPTGSLRVLFFFAFEQKCAEKEIRGRRLTNFMSDFCAINFYFFAWPSETGGEEEEIHAINIFSPCVNLGPSSSVVYRT